MAKNHPLFTEMPLQTADDLWLALSPTNQLRPGPHSCIFRGQADSSWSLIPSILRPRNQPPITTEGEMVDASFMVFLELEYLSSFARHCDNIGISIPNDSQEFRREVMNTQKAGRFFRNPSLWPDTRILDLMAMAQHHGVPTRLLDWTTKAYTAAYFAASSALSRFGEWEQTDRLAIWALDIELIGLHPEVVLHRAPGAVSRHLAAQGGLFTVHPHSGERDGEFVVQGFENYFSDLPDSPLIKITIPVFESARLLRLCSQAGFSAAHIYPSADGAGRAVIDGMNIDGAVKRWNGNKIRVR
ncbi:hypothetical protein C1886_12175 [Pseudomonas sp. FW300-N1A1]|uniref:FRG domain-containing protein n=1 Tax=Pseudomonas sp. FW300-N1A1 TaxID=2075555 RepID=UPI000CD0ACAD|nr:FRG domain-containing protein [Pseudomonas sp. FW300-N1A1]POA19628.1 hypothetical protein C1886_12175 [Pseudomonas sp. FW300-N1A1]